MGVDWETLDIDTGLFLSELEACGLPVPSKYRNGAPVFERTLSGAEQTLLERLACAHSGDASACQALCDLLGEASAEWLNRQDRRRAYAERRRKRRYERETDHMILDVLADVDPTTLATNLGISQSKIDAWLAARAVIQADLPYE